MLKRLNLQTESGEAVADVGYENERVIIKYYGEKFEPEEDEYIDGYTFEDVLNNDMTVMTLSAINHNELCKKIDYLVNSNPESKVFAVLREFEKMFDWDIVKTDKSLDDMVDSIYKYFESSQERVEWIGKSDYCDKVRYGYDWDNIIKKSSDYDLFDLCTLDLTYEYGYHTIDYALFKTNNGCYIIKDGQLLHGAEPYAVDITTGKNISFDDLPFNVAFIPTTEWFDLRDKKRQQKSEEREM
jgi:hypothetical protein